MTLVKDDVDGGSVRIAVVCDGMYTGTRRARTFLELLIDMRSILSSIKSFRCATPEKHTIFLIRCRC